MCGITGIFAFTEKGKSFFTLLQASLDTLKNRGPDGNGMYVDNTVALGHSRLAVIDTSEAGNQPMSDNTGRYTIVFNGEFFNFREHRKTLLEQGVLLKSQSDTEVLLYLYIREKEKCLEKINGFFSFAVYDKAENSLFIARDRFGIKPLFYYQNENYFLFASELKALLAFGIPKIIDEVSLFTYFQLNYIPAPDTIFINVKKLLPGHYFTFHNSQFTIHNYYSLPEKPEENISFRHSQFTIHDSQLLFTLLSDAVEKRLISDVPLGTFLSGGIDSSIITALAAQHTSHLKTFSIGYKDEPLFDETYYAALVARKYKTEHTVFSLSNNDLFANLHQVLEYTDEPFADSSALAVHILSMHTQKHVTVALSGDGADELFAGYNKHEAEYKARQNGIVAKLLVSGLPIWRILPKSRNTKYGNLFRQLQRFAEGMLLSHKERYWRWAGFMNETETRKLLNRISFSEAEYIARKEKILSGITENGDMNEVLNCDMKFILPNDMLVKTDMMSMANSLEVRVPFLDYRVVDFVSSLPIQYKIDGTQRKKILKDTFRSYLPEELLSRKKHGFEVPLLKWFRTELKSMITDDLLEDKFIERQGIFNTEYIRQLKQKLFSQNPGDAAATVWALVVFQYWWKKIIISETGKTVTKKIKSETRNKLK